MACRLGSCVTIGHNVLWDKGSIPSHDCQIVFMHCNLFMWFQFLFWILWKCRNWLCLILNLEVVIHVPKIIGHDFFVKLCHSNPPRLTKWFHTLKNNCSLNSNFVKIEITTIHIPNATWNNHMLFLNLFSFV
jgi:hypothetical protein